MSAWDPHRDLARLLAALGRELVAADKPEVRAACFDDGDSIAAAAQEVRELIGALIDDPHDPDDPAADVRAPGPADSRELRARQH
jgi:hypothetical protein